MWGALAHWAKAPEKPGWSIDKLPLNGIRLPLPEAFTLRHAGHLETSDCKIQVYQKAYGDSVWRQTKLIVWEDKTYFEAIPGAEWKLYFEWLRTDVGVSAHLEVDGTKTPDYVTPPTGEKTLHFKSFTRDALEPFRFATLSDKVDGARAAPVPLGLHDLGVIKVIFTRANCKSCVYEAKQQEFRPGGALVGAQLKHGELVVPVPSKKVLSLGVASLVPESRVYTHWGNWWEMEYLGAPETIRLYPRDKLALGILKVPGYTEPIGRSVVNAIVVDHGTPPASAKYTSETIDITGDTEKIIPGKPKPASQPLDLTEAEVKPKGKRQRIS